MLEFAIHDLGGFVNNGNGERIRAFMNSSNKSLITKLESNSPYSGSLDITVNPDKSVSSCGVKFTSPEIGIISAYYSTYKE